MAGAAMTREEHITRHRKLHKALDELVADFLRHTSGGLGTGLHSPIEDLMRWSFEQTNNPTPGEGDEG